MTFVIKYRTARGEHQLPVESAGAALREALELQRVGAGRIFILRDGSRISLETLARLVGQGDTSTGSLAADFALGPGLGHPA